MYFHHRRCFVLILDWSDWLVLMIRLYMSIYLLSSNLFLTSCLHKLYEHDNPFVRARTLSRHEYRDLDTYIRMSSPKVIHLTSPVPFMLCDE